MEANVLTRVQSRDSHITRSIFVVEINVALRIEHVVNAYIPLNLTRIDLVLRLKQCMYARSLTLFMEVAQACENH